MTGSLGGGWWRQRDDTILRHGVAYMILPSDSGISGQQLVDYIGMATTRSCNQWSVSILCVWLFCTSPPCEKLFSKGVDKGNQSSSQPAFYPISNVDTGTTSNELARNLAASIPCSNNQGSVLVLFEPAKQRLVEPSSHKDTQQATQMTTCNAVPHQECLH